MRLAPNRYLKQNDPEFLDEKIREAIDASDDHWFKETADAFVIPIREDILNQRASVSRDGKAVYFTPEGLEPYISRANLPIRGAILTPLITGWAASLYRRFHAGDLEVLRTFRREGHLDETSADTYRSIINILGKQNNWQLNQSGLQNRYDAVAAKAKASILRNGKWPQWSPQHGKVRWLDAALLDQMGPDELAATITATKDLYKRLSESREDQQERLQDLADTAAGHRKYRTADRTELDGQVRHKEGPGAQYEFVGEHSEIRPTAGRMDRSTPVAESVKQLFIDPTTNKYYTKSSLHRLARVNPNLFRAMMRNDVNFMNSLLQQAE